MRITLNVYDDDVDTLIIYILSDIAEYNCKSVCLQHANEHDENVAATDKKRT